jgi:hypothetical protein
LRLWDVDDGKLIGRIHWPKSPSGNNPTRGSFSPDGLHAAWGTRDGVVRIYRLAHPGGSPRPTAAPEHEDKPPTPPPLAPDSSR